MSHKQDPNYQDFAASLRNGVLFVKMPRYKARALAISWNLTSRVGTTDTERMQKIVDFLLEEEKASKEYGLRSVFYEITPEECQKDIETLSFLAEHDPLGVIRLFRETLKLGLNNDPRVDWIARVGGPTKKSHQELEREELLLDKEIFPFGLGPAEDAPNQN